MQCNCCTSHKTQQLTCMQCWPKRHRRAGRKWFTKNPINIMHFISFDLAINKRELFSHTRQQVQGEGEVLFDFEMMMSIYMKKKKKLCANIWCKCESVHLKCDWMCAKLENEQQQFTTELNEQSRTMCAYISHGGECEGPREWDGGNKKRIYGNVWILVIHRIGGSFWSARTTEKQKEIGDFYEDHRFGYVQWEKWAEKGDVFVVVKLFLCEFWTFPSGNLIKHLN